MERLTPTIRALVVALTVAYFFFAFTPPLNAWMENHLLLGPRLFVGELWQPFTALLLNTRLTGWFFTLIGLWWVGAFVERVRGRSFFLRLFLGAGVLGNLVAALVAWALAGLAWLPRSDGASFAVTALFVAFARIYGSRQAQIWGALVMRADYFTWIIVGLGLLMRMGNGDWPGAVAELTVVALALVMTGGLASLRDRWRRGRVKRRYQVLDGGAERPGGGAPPLGGGSGAGRGGGGKRAGGRRSGYLN